MKRRDAIKQTSLILGYTLATSTSVAILHGCRATAQDDYIPEYLSKGDIEIIIHMAERIIPATDTPGAMDAQVHHFIDQTLARFYTAEEQKKFTSGLEAFKNYVMDLYGKSFDKLTFADQDKAMAYISRDTDTYHSLFHSLQEMTVAGFFTSEIGQMQVLNYNPIPGPYQGCVSYTTGTPMDSSHSGGW